MSTKETRLSTEYSESPTRLGGGALKAPLRNRLALQQGETHRPGLCEGQGSHVFQSSETGDPFGSHYEKLGPTEG